MNKHRQPPATPPAANGRAGVALLTDPPTDGADVPLAVAGGLVPPTLPPPVELPWLLTMEQAARLLGLSVRSVKRLVAEGVIPGVVRPLGRLVRLDRKALEAWIAKGCPPVRKGHGRK